MRKSSGENMAWVEVLLSRWGRRVIRDGSGGLGYAKCSVIAGAGLGDGVADPSPPPDVSDEDFKDVDRAVMELPVVLLGAVMVVYVLMPGASLSRQALRAGVERKSLSQYLRVAHRQIKNALDNFGASPQNCAQSVNGETVP